MWGQVCTSFGAHHREQGRYPGATRAAATQPKSPNASIDVPATLKSATEQARLPMLSLCSLCCPDDTDQQVECNSIEDCRRTMLLIIRKQAFGLRY